jgi:hypothetical protein
MYARSTIHDASRSCKVWFDLHSVSTCSLNQAHVVNHDQSYWTDHSSADSRKKTEQEAPIMDLVPRAEGRPSSGGM